MKTAEQVGVNFTVSFKVFIDQDWINDGFDEAAIHAKIQELEETLNEYAIPGVETKITDIKVKSKGLSTGKQERRGV